MNAVKQTEIMGQFTNLSNIQGPYYIVQIKNESVDLNDCDEYEANDENEYVSVMNDTNKYMLDANNKNKYNIHVENELQSVQHLIYMKNEAQEFEALTDVEPKILFEYVTYDDSKDFDVDNESQNDSMQTLKDNIFVNIDQNEEFVNKEHFEVIADQQEESDYQDTEYDENYNYNKSLVHEENGAQIWLLMEETANDAISNMDEREIQAAATNIQAAETEEHEIVVNDVTNEALASDWLLSKKRCKVKMQPHRKGVSKKKCDSEKKKLNINDLEKVKKTPKRSWVWKYFSKQNEVIYQCTICNSNLSIKGCNTNNMNRHIRAKHSNIYNMEVVSKPIESNQIENEEVKNDSETVLYNLPITYTEDNSHGCQPKLRGRSWVWWLFHQISSTVASCKLCKRKIIHGGSATGNLNRHIKLLHNEIYVRIKPEDRGGKRIKQAQDVGVSEIGNIDIVIEDIRALEEKTWTKFKKEDIIIKRALC